MLYFYPKDNTPGCSDRVGCSSGTCAQDQFAKAGCEDLRPVARLAWQVAREIQGKTRRSRSNCSATTQEELACAQFGVIKMKNMYGKKVRGIERSTFVLDGKGVLAREWRGVKVPGHAEEVLSFVKTL